MCFDIMLIILFVLSATLIYSLLMINVQGRTFELAMRRTMGTWRPLSPSPFSLCAVQRGAALYRTAVTEVSLWTVVAALWGGAVAWQVRLARLVPPPKRPSMCTDQRSKRRCFGPVVAALRGVALSQVRPARRSLA